MFTSLPAIITATALIGLGGSLFSPAARTYLMHEAGERRAEAFAVGEVFGNAGALIGPLLGGLLLTVDFRLVALVACAVFVVLTVAQIVVLPARAVEKHERAVLGSLGDVMTNRWFVAFALAGSAYFALYNQLYPPCRWRRSGSPGPLRRSVRCSWSPR